MSSRLPSFFHPFAAALSLWRNRYLVRQLTLRQVQTQYKGSFLGFAWMFARPLLMLAVYTFVFGFIWPRDVDGLPLGSFAVQMFCGLSVYNIFSASVNAACASVVSRTGFVKQVVFPLETLPFVEILTQLILSVAWFLLLFAGTFAIYGRLPVTCLLLPLVLVPLVLITSGLAWFVASLNVYVRDLKQFVPVALQVLFFATPIFWSLGQIKGDRAWIVRYLYLNPLTGLVEAARDVVVRGVLPDWGMLGILTLVGLLVWHLGYVWFDKTKKGFADVI